MAYIKNPVEMMKAIGDVGRKKGELSVFQLLLRGFMGGMFIAVGGALATVASTGISSVGLKKFMLGAVFPVGLIAIVLTGMELFTGDIMCVPVAVFQKKTTWGKVWKVWLWVLIGNFFGSIFWAYLMSVGPFVSLSASGATPNVFGQTAIKIAEAKVLTYQSAGAFGLWSVFMKAIGCNMLVNLAILLAFVAEDAVGKMLGIWFPIMAFVTTGFEHSIANMYFVPVGMMLGANVSWGQFLYWNLIPVILGNIVGGLLLIGVVYHLAHGREAVETN